MARLSIPFRVQDADARAQLEYALAFVADKAASCRLDAASSTIEVDVHDPARVDDVRERIEVLVRRYEKGEFGLAKAVFYRHDRPHEPKGVWEELLARRWVTPVGEGHVVLRGVAAQLAEVVDRKIDRMFAAEFRAERELYPSTILCSTLDRIHHFTSFPEHVDFVSHLKRDLGVIDAFADDCRERRWAPERHDGRMDPPDFAIAPSCCYHAYEAMAGWELAAPGRCITAALACHRFEGSNHRTMTRLRAFTMREVIWVGEPRFVMESRARADELIVQWARDWELACTLETASDMFFTDDFATKASFQRQQQAKKELRLAVPDESIDMSVFSSNFHATTFGKAFGITVGGRSVASGCVGWGIERWVYAVLSQFGVAPERWPEGLRRDFDELSRS
jgi:seryl-tRNA synthetase